MVGGGVREDGQRGNIASNTPRRKVMHPAMDPAESMAEGI